MMPLRSRLSHKLLGQFTRLSLSCCFLHELWWEDVWRRDDSPTLGHELVFPRLPSFLFYETQQRSDTLLPVSNSPMALSFFMITLLPLFSQAVASALQTN